MRPGLEAGNSRHVYGPRGIGALMAPVTRAVFRRRSPAAAQVMADWAAIVGPALAAATVPRGLHGGTLTIACSGPEAMELQHRAPHLMGRINAALGAVTVVRLRFVQAEVAAPVRAVARVPSAAMAAEAERRVAGLPEGPLRDALSGLGRAVLAKEEQG